MRTGALIVACAFGVLLSVALGGCGRTKIHESHILQARGADDRISYFRVTLKGDAKLAKTQYRAGLYDAEALDALMNEISPNDQPAIGQELERQRKEAASLLASRYYEALAQEPGDDAANQEQDRKIEVLAQRLNSALQSPYVIAALAAKEGQPPVRRKFAIIFSANASVVEEAIADLVEAKETTAVMNAAIASIKREAFIEAAVEQENLHRLRKFLQSVKTQAVASESMSDDEKHAEVERLLKDIATMIVD